MGRGAGEGRLTLAETLRDRMRFGRGGSAGGRQSLIDFWREGRG